MDVGLHFRATRVYAKDSGLVGGLPTFFVANYTGTVYGTLLLRPVAADCRDVPFKELGISPETDFAERFRATLKYAAGSNYVGGFPNFFQADYGAGLVQGTILLRSPSVEFRDIPATDLGNPPDYDAAARFRAVQTYAVRRGFVGGLPTFFQTEKRVLTPIPPGFRTITMYGTLLFPSAAAEFRDVPAEELSLPPDSNAPMRFQAVQLYAARHGFVGGLPTFFRADHDPRFVCGTILLRDSIAK